MHTPCCSTCGRPYASGPCTRPSLDATATPSRPRAPRPALPPHMAGFARRVRAFALGAMLALGCNPVRGVILTAARAPAAEPCSPRTERCRPVPGGRVPEACGPRGDGQRAFWPATPTGEPCVSGCEVLEDGGARCVSTPWRRDSGVTADVPSGEPPTSRDPDPHLDAATPTLDAEVPDGE